MMTTVDKLLPLRLGLRDQPRDSRGAFARDLSKLRDSNGRPYKVLDLRDVERRLKERQVNDD